MRAKPPYSNRFCSLYIAHNDFYKYSGNALPRCSIIHAAMSVLFLDDDDYFEHLIEIYATPVQSKPPRPRNRGNNVTAEELERSAWGQLINSPDVGDPLSRNGIKFRARFRTPYPLFSELLVPLCIQYNVFKIQRENFGVPVKFRVLIGLRFLARAHDSDTMEELSQVKSSTCHTIFHQFIDGMVEHLFPLFLLKDLLITSFNYQLKIGQVYWPRRFEAWQKDCLAIQKIQARIAKEVFNALYGAVSNYVDRQGDSLGQGLFSTIAFVRGDVIAEFHGDLISYEDYLDLELQGMHRFVIKVKHGVYLDCRKNRFKGRCKASLANSPLHAVHKLTGVRAVANCSLHVSGPAGDHKAVTLVCSANRIDRNTEILWCYGSGHNCVPSVVQDDLV
jgi:hypothetical protein